MHVRRAAAAAIVTAAVIGAPVALADQSQVPTAQQTHPSVSPKVGRRHRTFHLTFTLAQAPGGSGTTRADYQAVVSVPAHAAASCRSAQPAAIFTGSRGSTTTLALRPPPRGWCKGRYLVTVFLQHVGPCGPPVGPTARAAIVCPEIEPGFPVNEVNTGEAHFTVR